MKFRVTQHHVDPITEIPWQEDLGIYQASNADAAMELACDERGMPLGWKKWFTAAEFQVPFEALLEMIPLESITIGYTLSNVCYRLRTTDSQDSSVFGDLNQMRRWIEENYQQEVKRYEEESK